jgi:hypothetical protein
MIPETDKRQMQSLSRAVRGGTLDPQRLAERAYAMGCAACHSAITLEIQSLAQTLNLSLLGKVAMEKALLVSGGDLQAAAKLLGVGKTTVYRKARQYGFLTGGSARHCCPNCGYDLRRPLRSDDETSRPGNGEVQPSECGNEAGIAVSA